MRNEKLCGFIYSEHCAYLIRTGDTIIPSEAELYPNDYYEENQLYYELMECCARTRALSTLPPGKSFQEKITAISAQQQQCSKFITVEEYRDNY